MDENIKNRYSQIHTDIKRCEENAKRIAQRISELPDCEERRKLFEQINDEVSTLTRITFEVISDLLKT